MEEWESDGTVGVLDDSDEVGVDLWALQRALDVQSAANDTVLRSLVDKSFAHLRELDIQNLQVCAARPPDGWLV